MKLDEMATEVLNIADASYLTNGISRVVKLIHTATTTLLRSGEHTPEDMFGFYVTETKTVSNDANAEVSMTGLLVLKEVYYAGDNRFVTLHRADDNERRRWSLSGLTPEYTINYYLEGNKIKFVPVDRAKNMPVNVMYIKAPADISSTYETPDASKWYNNTEMNNLMSLAMQYAVIQAAATLFRTEISTNVG